MTNSIWIDATALEPVVDNYRKRFISPIRESVTTDYRVQDGPVYNRRQFYANVHHNPGSKRQGKPEQERAKNYRTNKTEKPKMGRKARGEKIKASKQETWKHQPWKSEHWLCYPSSSSVACLMDIINVCFYGRQRKPSGANLPKSQTCQYQNNSLGI